MAGVRGAAAVNLCRGDAGCAGVLNLDLRLRQC